MKKVLLFLMAAFISLGAFAKGQPQVSVKSGDINVLREKVTATLTLDWEGTTWEEDQSFETWSGEDYLERIVTAQTALANSFNGAYGPKVVEGKEANDAKYKIVFKIDNLEQHQAGLNFGQLTLAITGTMDFIDIKTGKVALSLSFHKFKGLPEYAFLYRMKVAFACLGVKLCGKKLKI